MILPQLRDYQLSVLEKAREHYVGGKRWGIIQAITGAGKTFVQAEQTRRAVDKGLPVILVAPLRRLVDQISQTLGQFGIDHGVIMDGRPNTPALAQVCSRDTLYSMIENNVPLPPARLAIFDECHVSYDRLLKLYQSAFGTGYTASPCKSDGSGLGWPWQFIESAVPAEQLIADKHLIQPVCYYPKEVAQKRMKGERVKPSGNPVYHWRKFADGLRTVVFASNRAEAAAYMKDFIDDGIPSEYLDGDSSDEERDAILGTRTRTGRLETKETLIVFTVGILLMGVDVPSLQCAVFLRSCGSFLVWCQGCGRPMRPYPGQEHCVIIDHSGAVEEFGMPEWEKPWTVNPDDNIGMLAKKKTSEDKIICCPKCSRVFSKAKECPGCGWKIPKPKKSQFKMLAEQADAVLTEFQGTPHGVMMAHAAFQKLWDRCLYATARRGGMVKQAAGMFSGATKRPVWECGVDPMPERHEFAMPVAQVFPHIVGART